MNLSHILDYCRGCLHLHTCANTHSIKPFLTVNLGVLQLLNMLLAQLIGISNNYADRQAEIFRHAKDNSIKLEAYIKQITMSQKQFDKQHQELHQSITQFRLPQGTHSYIYTGLIWSALSSSYPLF